MIELLLRIELEEGIGLIIGAQRNPDISVCKRMELDIMNLIEESITPLVDEFLKEKGYDTTPITTIIPEGTIQ